MNRILLERLIRSLSLGVRTMTILHDEVKVPNPTLNTLIFHKSQKGNYYVTLQAQTELLNGILTYKEVDAICNFLAKLSEMNEKCYSNFRWFFDCALITSSVVVTIIPLILGTIYGAWAFLVGFLIYFVVMIILYMAKKLT